MSPEYKAQSQHRKIAVEELETEAQERLVDELDEAKNWASNRIEKFGGYPYYKLRVGDFPV